MIIESANMVKNFAKAIGINENNDRLISMIERMLFSIFEENYKIEIKYIKEADVALVGIGIQNSSRISPIHMPFGISYILPILSALALSIVNDRNSLIVIENPEAHLHPQAQSNLGYLFTEFSNRGNLQIILETHSDHIINGILRGIKDKKIFNNDV